MKKIELNLKQITDIRTALDYWSEYLEKNNKPRAKEIKDLALYFDRLIAESR